MAAEFEDVEIVINGVSAEKIIVNGEDIKNRVAAINYSASANEVPVLTIYQHPLRRTTITGKAIVQDVVGLKEFLNSIDPEELEKAVIAEGSFSDTYAVTAMRVLVRWAEGAERG